MIRNILTRFARLPLALAASAVLLVGGCSDTVTNPEPLIVDEGPNASPYITSSFTADVDLVRKTVTITPPTAGLNTSRILGDYFGVDPSAELSLVGGDVVDVQPVAGTLEFAPANLASGRRRVAFEMTVRNKLSGTALEVPVEFPQAPTGVASPVIFAFRNIVTTTTGTVTGGNGQGNIIEIGTPNEGDVLTSDSIWAGPPHNFFNEAVCSGTGEVDGSSDCFLYLPIVEEVTLADVIGGGATSEPIRVGYDIELTVNNFRSNLIVGADLTDATPNTAPDAVISPATDPGTCYVGVPFALDGTGSSDPDIGGFISGYNWSVSGTAGGSFDPDNTSSTTNYIAAAVGNATVELIVTDNRSAASAPATLNLSCTLPPSDITASISAPATAINGTAYTVTVEVSEIIGGDAQAPITTVTLPAGVTPTNITGGGVFSSGTIEWDPGVALTGGTTETFTYDVTAGAAGTDQTHSVSVSSSNDSNNTNNGPFSVTVTSTAAPNMLGRWVVQSSSLHAAGTSLDDGDQVANGDVLEFQICVVDNIPNSAEITSTWNPAILDASAIALLQSTDANAHIDCSGSFDELNEFFSAGPVSQSTNNKAAAIDLTTPAPTAAYTAGLARYTFEVIGTSGQTIDLTFSSPLFSNHGGATPTPVVDYEGLVIQ